MIVGTEEEILIAGGEKTAASSLSAIQEKSSATVVLKRGEKGCEVYSPDSDKPISARSFQIEVLNVLGAGDAFMSGFCAVGSEKKLWKPALFTEMPAGRWW